MFGQQKQPPIKSLIAGGTVITGHIDFADGLRVDGRVVGNLIADQNTPSLLVISESAVIVGEVSADHVIVNGAVQGPIYARQLLELQPKAKIEGDISYAALEMHQGAVISGQLRPLTHHDADKPILKLAASNA
jgi:cytoskeletal protein CcmA (bactofilin family)